MWRDGEVLVSCRTPATVAGVVVRNGRPCLGVWSPGTSPVGVTLLEANRPSMIGATLGSTAVGGALPAGARIVEAVGSRGQVRRATVRNGWWVVILPDDPKTMHGPPPIRYRRTVRRKISELPTGHWPQRIGAERAAQLVARGLPESCPTCGRTTWGFSRHATGGDEQIMCNGCGWSMSMSDLTPGS